MIILIQIIKWMLNRRMVDQIWERFGLRSQPNKIRERDTA